MSCYSVRRLLALLGSGLILPFTTFSQKPYFQQSVDYRIVASLDDGAHRLSARLELTYTNNSPDTLNVLWMHLWPNAYASRRSAFARQQLRNGSAKFYFSEKQNLGGITALDFTVNGQKATWQFDPENPDIAVVNLPRPLTPRGKLTLTTPFEVDIPASFSRLGHVGTSYQMTQWYPKPAVYDMRGWHAMPYLDQGEFFSEFGSFDVTITLPENYVVGATGTLETASERDFLLQKERETRAWLRQNTGKPGRTADSFPPSAVPTKTLRYTASDVHDFAWFADKRFLVLKDTARLADGATVDCWAMFLPSDARYWREGAFYVRRAVEFYSRHVGAYPWPQATAVHSALSAGGGMEYPMITVIGDAGSAAALDEVITHEVGHNWFYGILASNERDHPWMDEGINSYYERRYMAQYHGRNVVDGGLPQFLADSIRNGSLVEIGTALLAREHRDRAPDSPSDTFTSLGYGLQVYMKPALALEWVEQAVGREPFDAAMQAYFRKWKFRHPYPEDLRASWEAAGLKADFFFDLMQEEKLRYDFRLIQVQPVAGGYKVWLRYRSFPGILYGFPGPARPIALAERLQRERIPIPVTALRDGKPIVTRWLNGKSRSAADMFLIDEKVDEFVVDYYRTTLDIRRKNNSRRTGGLFPGFEPLRFQPLAPFDDARHSTLAALPWLGWNNYNKLMLGAVLYNPPLPTRRLQYYLAPGYSFGSNQLVGLADLRLRLYPGGTVPKLTLGVSGKKFEFNYHQLSGHYSSLWRLVPQLRAELADRSNTFFHALNFRTLFMQIERPLFGISNPVTGEPIFAGTGKRGYTLHELRYEGEQRLLPNPYRFSVVLEQQSYSVATGNEHYLRSTAEWQQKFFYRRNKKLTARLFAGYFLQNTRRNAGAAANDLARGSLALNPQGFNDYRFDEVFFGRSEAEGFLSRQVSQSDGGFKTAFGAPFGSAFGTSNNYLLALNLRADPPLRLPLRLPLKAYFDLGYYDPALSAPEFVWSGGLMLSFLGGTAELYFPLVNSPFINDRYRELAGNNYFQRISWSINLKEILPERLIERFLR